TKEQLAMVAQCKTPEELIEFAKTYGFDLTKEQAEAYLDELQDIELDPEVLERVAGGGISSLKPAKTKKLFIPTVNIL
ncbi:MAG: DUF2624 family protein, partial [Spirochaetia bacterium]|nr:DUF2624 family protein [Spirochaetia bacterium]